MRKSIITLLAGLIILISCNDKPEVQPLKQEILWVYPNPTTDWFNISIASKTNQPFTLHVFNPKGKLIHEEEGNLGGQSYFIDLGNEQEGNFQIILKTDDIKATQKLIKL